MKKIFTVQGDEIFVDDEDYELVSRFRWITYLKKGTRYSRPELAGYKIRPQHLIVGNDIGKGKMIDHINRNPFDNRRSNLRVVSGTQNSMNRNKRIKSKSIYKGVRRCSTKSERWSASIANKGIQYYLGVFSTERDAAIAYDKKAKELFGEFAFLNFPESI